MGERTIAICNAGKCPLEVTSVELSRKSKHWRLVNNPFPATVRPGACLSVLIRYKATEKCPRCRQLIIKSNDPETPVKKLDLMAYTVAHDAGCGKANSDCKDECCSCPHDKGCNVQALDACCFDEECVEDDDDEC